MSVESASEIAMNFEIMLHIMQRNYTDALGVHIFQDQSSCITIIHRPIKVTCIIVHMRIADNTSP